MRRIFYLLFVVSATFLITSCQKEVSVDSSGGSGTGNPVPGGNAGGGGSGSTALKGDWKFISQEAALKSTVQYTEPISGTTLKSVTTTNYTTLDNKGEIKISDTKMTLSGMTYRVAATSYGEIFTGNQLTDTLSFPLEYTMPEYNSDGDYKFVGSDSIYFTATSFSFIQGTSMPSGPSRFKYVIEGNKLKLFSDYKEAKTETQQGVTAQILHEVKMIIDCERK